MNRLSTLWEIKMIFPRSEKIFVKTRRKVEPKEITAIAEKYGIPYKEVSAKNGENIKKLFKEITKRVFHMIDKSDFLSQAEEVQ